MKTIRHERHSREPPRSSTVHGQVGARSQQVQPTVQQEGHAQPQASSQLPNVLEPVSKDTLYRLYVRRARPRATARGVRSRDRTHEIATRSPQDRTVPPAGRCASVPPSPDLKRYSPQVSPRASRARPASRQRGSSSAVLRCRRPGQCLPLSLRPPPPHLPRPLARLPLDEGQCRLQGRLLVGSASPRPAPRRAIEGRARLHRVEHRGAEHEAHLLRGRLGMA